MGRSGKRITLRRNLNIINNLDEIQKRILNGDGGSWIGDPYGGEVIEQLDRFHVVKEIKQNIADKPYQKEVLKLPEASEGLVYKHMGVQENLLSGQQTAPHAHF